MSHDINTGFSAFPTVLENDCNLGHRGMTLRDYFAAKAMSALIAEPQWGEDSNSAVVSFGDGFKGSPLDRFAHVSYLFADAMLRAREPSNG